MNEKILASGLLVILVFILLFRIGTPDISAQQSKGNWTIIGNKVFVNDSNIYLSQYPHTTSGKADIQLQTKSFTGNIDLVFGFNTTENVLPTGVSVFKPRNITTQTNHSYTCETNYFNYTLTPKHFWCWDNITYINCTVPLNTTCSNNSKLVLRYEHDFDTGNIPLKTAYWSSTETHQEDWQDFSDTFQSINYNYGGNNKWYYARNLPVIAGKMYDINMELDIPPKLGTSYGKYWICTKPSSETIAQAVANSHLYCIDPWWNSSWDYRYLININLTTEKYSYFSNHVTAPVVVNITTISGNKGSIQVVCNTSGTDIVTDYEWFNQKEDTGDYTNKSIRFLANFTNGTLNQDCYVYSSSTLTAATNKTLFEMYEGFEMGSTTNWKLVLTPTITAISTPTAKVGAGVYSGEYVGSSGQARIFGSSTIDNADIHVCWLFRINSTTSTYSDAMVVLSGDTTSNSFFMYHDKDSGRPRNLRRLDHVGADTTFRLIDLNQWYSFCYKNMDTTLVDAVSDVWVNGTLNATGYITYGTVTSINNISFGTYTGLAQYDEIYVSIGRDFNVYESQPTVTLGAEETEAPPTPDIIPLCMSNDVTPSSILWGYNASGNVKCANSTITYFTVINGSNVYLTGSASIANETNTTMIVWGNFTKGETWNISFACSNSTYNSSCSTKFTVGNTAPICSSAAQSLSLGQVTYYTPTCTDLDLADTKTFASNLTTNSPASIFYTTNGTSIFNPHSSLIGTFNTSLSCTDATATVQCSYLLTVSNCTGTGTTTVVSCPDTEISFGGNINIGVN